MYIRRNMGKKIFLFFCLLLAVAATGFGQCSLTVTNASFETPALTVAATTSTVTPTNLTGWTNSQTVTIWRSPQFASGTTTNTVVTTAILAAKAGIQFVELGVNQSATMYQDIPTPGPAQLTVKFSHRGRGGAANGNKDECELYAGPPNGSLFSLKTVSDNNQNWIPYTVVYTVPAGQVMTRLQFFGGPTASGSGGNFLDDIQIVTDTSIRGSNSISLSCTAYSTTVVTAGLSGTWIPNLNNPSTTTIVTTGGTTATYTSSTVFSGFALPGTYHYTWYTGYCDTPLTITVSTISAVTPTLSYNTPVYSGNVLSLSAIASPGATYGWKGPNSFTSTLSNTVVSNNATTNMSGIYSLTATLTNSCSPLPLAKSISVTVMPVTITLSPANVSLNGGSSVTLTVNIAPAFTTSSQTITLAATGNAFSGTHYTGLPSQVIIPPNASSVSFTITGLNNNILNAVNSLVIQASSPYYASGSATVTILDSTGNDPTNRMITVSSGVVTETLSKTLTLSLTGTVTTHGPITVTINDPGFPLGYTITPNPVVIQAGGHSATFTIQTGSDNAIPDNYFAISGTAQSGGDNLLTVIASSLTVTNKNQSLTINPITPTVGGTVSVTVSRSAPGAGALTYSITASVGGGSATIDASGNLTTIRVGSITLIVGSSGDSNFLSASIMRVINIVKVTPLLSITSGTSMIVGGTLQVATSTTATVSSGGSLSFIITAGSGSASVDPSTGLITASGAGTVTLTANSAGDSNYNVASTSTVITITSGSQSLTLSSSSGSFSTSVGTSITVIASSSVAGGGAITYSVVGGSGSATVDQNTGLVTGISVGAVTLVASAATNVDYVGAATTTVLTIGISSQTLTINPPVTVAIGNSITVSTTRSVANTLKGGALSYTLIVSGSGSATINEVTGNLQGVGAGTLTLRVTALGNTNYYSSVSNTILITIKKGTPTLSLTNTTQSVNMTVGGTLSFITTSTPPVGGLPSTGGITFSVVTGSQSSTIDASTGQLTAVRAGQIVVQVVQGSDVNYNAPLAATLIITIKKSTPTLSLTSTTQSANMTVGSVLSLTATSTPPLGGLSSTGSIVFSIVTGSQSATINAATGQLTAIRAGTIVVRAVQSSDVNYNAPLAVTLTITIGKSTPSLSLTTTTAANSLAVDGMLTIVGTSVPTSPGSSVFSTGSIIFSVVPTLVGGGSATIHPNTGQLTAKASGSVLVQAIQASDVNYYQSITGTLTITVNSGGQIVTFSSSNYSLVVDQALTITAANSVTGGGAITYSVSAGSGSATVDENTGQITAIGAGTVTLVAQAAANSNYTIATTSALLVIGKGSQILSITPSANIMSIGQPLALSATSTATGGRGGTIVYGISGGSGSATVNSSGLISAISEGTVTFEASTSGDSNYDGARVSRVITIAQGLQTLTITSVSSTVVGGSITASVTTTASTSDGGIGVASYDLSPSGGPGSATIDPLTHVIRGVQAGTVLLTITTPGDAKYGGTSVTQTITIGRGTPTLSVGAPTTTIRVDDVLPIAATSLPALTGGVVSTGLITYRIVNTIGGGSATIDSTGALQAQSVGSVVVEASQAPDNNYYSPAPATLTITINQGIQSLQIISDDFMGLYGPITAVVTTTVNGGSGGLISYSISNATGAASVSAGGIITASQLGKVTLIASTLGNTNYGPATTSQVINIVSLSMRMITNTLLEGTTGSVTLSLYPIGATLAKDVVFNLVGSTAKSGHYSIPSTITLLNGRTEVSIPVSILSDKILYNNEVLVLGASNSSLGSVTSSLSITDGTALDPANLIITINNGTIYLEGTAMVEAHLPVGVSSALPIVVGFRLNDRSDVNLLASIPQVGSSVTILGDEQSNSGMFAVTATSANENLAKIIIEGVSVTVAGNSVSFTAIKEGVVTVINQKIIINQAVSVNADGVGDCFMVDNVDKYPDNEVSILSRYSLLVYQAHGYNNKDVIFCGKSNQRGTYSKLEPGTYYYVIRFKESATKENVFKGYLEVR